MRAAGRGRPDNYAHQARVERGHVRAGETVLVLRARCGARCGFAAPDVAALDTPLGHRRCPPRAGRLPACEAASQPHLRARLRRRWVAVQTRLLRALTCGQPAAGGLIIMRIRRVSSAGTSGPEKPCWYCEPHVARDAVAQRLTWPHSTRLSVTDAVRRSPADCPHVRPLRSRISVRACGAGGSQYQHGSFGLSHAGSRLVVRLDDRAHQARVSTAATSGPQKPCWYCEPHVARDAVAQRLTWPHSTRLSVTDAVRRSPADCPHVRPLRSR